MAGLFEKPSILRSVITGFGNEEARKGLSISCLKEVPDEPAASDNHG